MGSLFDHYGKLIVGIMAAILIIVVVVVIGNQFKHSSVTQFNNLENVVNEQMVDLQSDDNITP